MTALRGEPRPVPLRVPRPQPLPCLRLLVYVIASEDLFPSWHPHGLERVLLLGGICGIKEGTFTEQETEAPCSEVAKVSQLVRAP